VLVKDGRIDREAMLNTHMSEGDLDEDLRKKGLQDAAKIAEAPLNGMERSPCLNKANSQGPKTAHRNVRRISDTTDPATPQVR
jgi:hypothetical protein